MKVTSKDQGLLFESVCKQFFISIFIDFKSTDDIYLLASKSHGY